MTSQSLFQIRLLIVEEQTDTESNSIKRNSNQGLRARDKHREGEVRMSDAFGYYSLWDRIQVKLQLKGTSGLTFQFYLINCYLRYWYEVFKACEDTMRSPKHQRNTKITSLNIPILFYNLRLDYQILLNNPWTKLETLLSVLALLIWLTRNKHTLILRLFLVTIAYITS